MQAGIRASKTKLKDGEDSRTVRTGGLRPTTALIGDEVSEGAEDLVE